METFLDAGGDLVDREVLATAKARQLVRLISSGHPFARLVECRQDPSQDLVILDLDIEVPQVVVHDIRTMERVSIGFDREDRRLPEILALRSDFPLVPHLNLGIRERPRSLCLFDEAYRDLKRRWTASMLVERIREWLRLTARGELHGEDQPLEPLLLDTVGTIIVPHGLFRIGPSSAPQPVSLNAWQDDRGRWMVVARRVEAGNGASGEGQPHVEAATFMCAPREHACIRRTPKTLRELHEMLTDSGDDLIGHLRAQVLQWKDMPSAENARVLLLIAIPKTRAAGSEVEATDLWAFMTSGTIREIGQAVGCWEVIGGQIGLLVPIDTLKEGESIGLDLLNVVPTLPRTQAAWLSGFSAPSDVRVTAIGAGALGSQVIMNAARSAFGCWTVIDDDALLPHNLVRHACYQYVGGPKAVVVAFAANGIIDGAPALTAISADVLAAGPQQEAVDRSLREADVILDMSASLSVARFLARDAEGPGRRISLFLNPTGTDVVLLAEDSGRTVPLDVLEMQYYRALLADPRMAGHLDAPTDRVRYGRSCRDVTVRLPQELVSLHAAVAFRGVRAAIEMSSAACKVWRTEEPALGLRTVQIEVATVREYRCSDWTICTDAAFEERLDLLRRERLPGETGGVLLGALDLEREIIYVVETIPSPPDSFESPTAYIRGCQGLEERVREAEKGTGYQLQYIGEWHSHPAGYACEPSKDDKKLLQWLTRQMDVDGFPGVVLIVGDGATVVPHVGISGADGMIANEGASPP